GTLLSPALARISSPLPDGQHWTWCQPDHLCGDAAVEHVVEAGTAMRAHDNEISPTLVCYADDGFCWGPGCDFHLPRAVEAMAHAITEARQGLFIVILEHNGGRWGACGTKAPLQGGIETHLCPRHPSDDIHLCPGMRWQHMQEGHCGVMYGRFCQGVA